MNESLGEVGGKILDELTGGLVHCWTAGVAAADAGAAVSRALAADPPPDAPLHVLALGKASAGMAGAAVAWLADHRRTPAGGLIVTPRQPGGAAALAPGVLPVVVGDHPVPGARSTAAAAALEEAARVVAPDDAVLVLLSGGTSSLVGAPVPGVPAAEFGALWTLLLDSGLDISAMNAVRRRFARWGGGRLALALGAREVDVLAVSDVPGDHLGVIGSGPCADDPTTLEHVRELLRSAGLLSQLPPRCRELLDRSDDALATAGSGAPELGRVRSRIVASNADAVAGAAHAARSLGWSVHMAESPIAGDAATAGRRLAHQLLDPRPDVEREVVCIVAGGEATVALSSTSGLGGRCQELALAAAELLAGASLPAALLAAGTDGRDGPTDAAGAVVTGATWGATQAAGRSPARDLARHDSHAALAAADALLRTGPTGTNVMDLVVGARRGRD